MAASAGAQNCVPLGTARAVGKCFDEMTMMRNLNFLQGHLHRFDLKEKFCHTIAMYDSTTGLRTSVQSSIPTEAAASHQSNADDA